METEIVSGLEATGLIVDGELWEVEVGGRRFRAVDEAGEEEMRRGFQHAMESLTPEQRRRALQSLGD